MTSIFAHRPGTGRSRRSERVSALPRLARPGSWAERLGRASALLAAMVALVCASACGRGEPAEGGASGEAGASGPAGVRVVVSIPPLAGLVEGVARAAGAEVSIVVPAGTTAHGFEVAPSDMGRLASADVVVLVGAGLEPWADRLVAASARGGSGPRVVTLAAAAGIEGQLVCTDPSHNHAAGEWHALGHGDDADGAKTPEALAALDPHLWLDPSIARHAPEAAAFAIKLRLKQRGLLSAERSAAIDLAVAEAQAEIDRVDSAYRETFLGVKGSEDDAKIRPIVVAHDAWRRIGARYRLTFIPLSGLEGGEATPASLARAADAITSAGALAVCLEPQMPRALGERLASRLNVPVLWLDPLGDGDWSGMMFANLRTLAEAAGLPTSPGSASAGSAAVGGALAAGGEGVGGAGVGAAASAQPPPGALRADNSTP